ncbi:MAG: hypothetical protein AAF799_07920 [Myxococcota bacterium]
MARIGLLSACVLMAASSGCRPASFEQRIEVFVPTEDEDGRRPADDLRTLFGPRPAVNLSVEVDSRPAAAKPLNAEGGVWLPTDVEVPGGIKTVPVP